MCCAAGSGTGGKSRIGFGQTSGEVPSEFGVQLPWPTLEGYAFSFAMHCINNAMV